MLIETPFEYDMVNFSHYWKKGLLRRLQRTFIDGFESSLKPPLLKAFTDGSIKNHLRKRYPSKKVVS